MLRCFQGICFLKVRHLKEVAAHFRREEGNGAEYHQKQNHHWQIMVHRVVGMKRNPVYWYAIRTLVLFDLNSIRVVGADFM